MPCSSRSILAWCFLWAVFAALMQTCGSFKYVYIPCDSSRPMEEWCLVASPLFSFALVLRFPVLMFEMPLSGTKAG